jgi:membrane-bound serine protease (ClpP class)
VPSPGTSRRGTIGVVSLSVAKLASVNPPMRHPGASALRRLGLSLLAIIACLLGLEPAVAQSPERQVLVVDIKGVIGFVTTTQLNKAVERAHAINAGALVVRLDTPGGLVTATRDMIQTILGSRVPIVVYVAPSGARAASAGTYLLYASHLAAMAPATHVGAATPIALGVPGMPDTQPSKPKDKSSDDNQSASERKTLNDAVAYMRTLAQLRGRNADWAEKAVREAATLTATEAVREKVVEVMSGSVPELLAAIDGRTVKTGLGDVRLATKGATITEIKSDWKMEILSAIADPNLAFMLLMIGFYGVLFELMNPSFIAPGVIGGICLVLGLTALSVLPVNYGGLALVFLGIALMVAEGFNPGFGIMGIGGLISFVLGALFLFDPVATDMRIAISWPLIAALAITSLLFFAGAAGLAMRARTRPVRTGSEQMLGSTAEVVSWSGKEGLVRANGEIWAAKSDVARTPGESVRVVGRTGLTLLVERKA